MDSWRRIVLNATQPNHRSAVRLRAAGRAECAAARKEILRPRRSALPHAFARQLLGSYFAAISALPSFSAAAPRPAAR